MVTQPPLQHIHTRWLFCVHEQIYLGAALFLNKFFLSFSRNMTPHNFHLLVLTLVVYNVTETKSNSSSIDSFKIFEAINIRSLGLQNIQRTIINFFICFH